MPGEICNKCGLKKFNFVFVDDGKICNECNDELQDSEEIKNIIQTSLPEGLVAFWIDKSSYISKKANQRYFKIPDRLKSSIIEGKEYQIIIKEVNYE